MLSDDLLELWDELRKRMTDLFKNFRNLNVKVKPSKIRLGTKVKFGRFQAEAVMARSEYCPIQG